VGDIHCANFGHDCDLHKRTAGDTVVVSPAAYIE
jgi:hypothetical protein